METKGSGPGRLCGIGTTLTGGEGTPGQVGGGGMGKDLEERTSALLGWEAGRQLASLEQKVLVENLEMRLELSAEA